MSRIKRRLRRREKNVLDMPLYRSGDSAQNPIVSEIGDFSQKLTALGRERCTSARIEVEVDRWVVRDSGSSEKESPRLPNFAYLRGPLTILPFRPSFLSVSSKVNYVRAKVCNKTRGNCRLSGAAQKEDPHYHNEPCKMGCAGRTCLSSYQCHQL